MTMTIICRVIVFFALLSFFQFSVAQTPIGSPDLDDIEYPEDEPHSEAEIELGKILFFDPRLSINNNQSCATCHNPDLGFGDGLAKGIGTTGKALGRNTPHLYNLAWNVVFFWDGRSESLEDQALGPIQSLEEMGMSLELLTKRLNKVEGYKKIFMDVYGEKKISAESVGRAIAAFERSIVTKNSPFDQYLAGNKNAMDPAAIRGMKLFNGKARCVDCHDGPNLTDNSFHNIGIPDDDEGRAVVINDHSLKGAFKTPGLRNVVLTAPYMHDGSLGSLEEVIQYYNRGGDSKDNLDKLIKPLKLSDEEAMDLVAFMGALTDPIVISRPTLP